MATYLRIAPTPNVVRFTADGSLLAVTDPTRLHVLETATLKPTRLIDPQLEDGFRIFDVETSPAGHVAIIAADKYTSGILLAYDLDTGRLLFQWRSPHSVSSISWNADGTQFAIAAPFLCTHFRDTIHVFGTNPWQHLRTLTARDPVSVAFSREFLYFVEASSCKGSVFNRHLGLESFNVRGWNRRDTIFRPDRDIHDSVYFENGVLLANTGRVTTTFDWLDGVSLSTETSVEFTIWKGDPPSVPFTSSAPQPIPPSHPFQPQRLRLSRTGKMVLLNSEHPQVVQVP